ncbi:MAG: hypothetical protein R3F11_01185 [Verrucomicrobiales bacterium]
MISLRESSLLIAAATLALALAIGCGNPSHPEQRDADPSAGLIDPAAIEDFADYLERIAEDSANLPRTLRWMSAKGEVAILVVGTEESFGPIPCDPIAITFNSDGFFANRTPMTDLEFEGYLAKLMGVARMTDSEPILFIRAERGLSGARGFAFLEKLANAGIRRCVIPPPGF